VKGYRVAVPVWVDQDDMAEMIIYELRQLGHQAAGFYYTDPVPGNIEVLFTFGPYSKIIPIWESVALRQGHQRPVVAHLNTEGIPDLRIPYRTVRWLGSMRSWVGRLSHSRSALARLLSTLPPFISVDRVMTRYRYVGDYDYAYQRGWLHVLADTSQIYCALRNKAGMPTLYVPWGGSTVLYANLNLERDIDVIWMGKRGTKRRSAILDWVCNELSPYGVKIYIADNEQNPFIFHGTRTEYLNRAKITLNITRTWYDDNFSRFALAAPNRSLIISEPVLEHCIEFKANVHYIVSPISELSKTILYYLEHEAERERIVDNAYNLLTTELRFHHGIKRMMDAVEQVKST